MARHTVTESGLAYYIESHREEWMQYAVSSSIGLEVKRLMFQLGQVTPIYRVTCGDREIYIGALKETAVREYNELP